MCAASTWVAISTSLSGQAWAANSFAIRWARAGVTGSLGMVTVIACMFFGAVSGSAPATVAAINDALGTDFTSTPIFPADIVKAWKEKEAAQG